MSPAPYYMGDTVPLKFTVSDVEGDINPTDVKLVLLKPDNSEFKDDDVTVLGNEVSYLIASEQTEGGGEYKAYFLCNLPSDMGRTHKIEFKILRNPERSPR